MILIKSSGGYFYKKYKNGKIKRISKKEYLKLTKRLKMKGSGNTFSKCFGEKNRKQETLNTSHNFNNIILTLIYGNKRHQVIVNTSDSLHNIKINFMKYCGINLNEQDSYLFRKDFKPLNNHVPIINYITENANNTETSALTTHNPLSKNTNKNKGLNNPNEIILTLNKTLFLSPGFSKKDPLL